MFRGTPTVYTHRVDKDGHLFFLTRWDKHGYIPNATDRRSGWYRRLLYKGGGPPPDHPPRLSEHARMWRIHWMPAATPRVWRLPAVHDYADACSLPPPALGHELPTNPSPAGRVTITTAELDPDTNVGPQQDGPSIVLHSGAHHVYDSAGMLCGRLPSDRLRSLWERFQRARASQSSASVGTFEAEVCKLLRRLVNRARSSSTTTAFDYSHWAVPTPVMGALRALTGFDTECFGSPLNVHPDTPHYVLHPPN